MRIRVLCALATGGMLLVPAVASADQPQRATGGGQYVFDLQNFMGGPANTIGFSAIGKPTQGDDDAADGQVQVVDRNDGAKRGPAQEKYHGVVTCLKVSGNMARISGELTRKPTGSSDTRFNLYVEDNNEPNQGQDMIVFDPTTSDDDCDFQNPANDDQLSLYRGNAQVQE